MTEHQGAAKWLAGSPSKDSARDLVSGMISGYVAKEEGGRRWEWVEIEWEVARRG